MIVPREDCKPCEACRAPMVFARTTTKKAGRPVEMPIDPTPDPHGNVILTVHAGHYYAGVPHRNQLAGMRERGVELRTSHMATCPEAEKFKRKNRRAANR